MDEPLESRPLTTHEYHLVKWMLEHGNKDALPFLPQLELAAATLWRCPCGCASFNLVVKGHHASTEAHMHILADFVFGSEENLSGIFLFETGGMLAGVEVYGLAGDAPKHLPNPESLRSFNG